MDLQRKLEQLFCPPLDSALIAAFVNDNPDFDYCFDILSSLSNEANLYLENEVESELSSGNSSSNFRSFSSGETGDGSITSLEYSIDGLSVGDELDYASTCSTTDYDDFECSGFLKTCFPMISEERVDALLRENDNNAEIVLDVILNEMFLETEQQEEDFAYYSTSPPISARDSNYNSLVSEPHFKHRKKKRLRKQKPNNIIFQNNGHRPNSNKFSSSSSPVILGPPTSSPSSSTSSCWNTPWAPYEGQDEFVDDNKLSQLTSMFPDHDLEDLKRTLITCKGEVQNAIEMLISADTVGAWNLYRKQPATQSKVIHQPNSVVLHSNNRNVSIQDRTVGPSFPLNNNRFKIYDDDDDDDDDGGGGGYDHGYCRKEALKCFKQRAEALRKANEAYRRKDGSALYYSDEGRKFGAEMKIWNLRAARSLVKKQSTKRNDEYTLDLHGCSVDEALIIVKEWLNDWYPKRMTSASSMKPLKIITGKGNHSHNGVAKLPNAINKFLVKDDWDIKTNKGYVLVNGRS